MNGIDLKCPKCGQEMGPSMSPDDGSWFCGSIKCGYEINPHDPQTPIEDVREFLTANGIDTREAVSAVLRSVLRYGKVLD